MELDGIVKKIKNYFDWTPVAVSRPMTIYRDYRDVGRVLIGYQVTVVYKHHGERKYLFCDDEDKLCLVSREQARVNAVNFYREKQKQIRQH